MLKYGKAVAMVVAAAGVWAMVSGVAHISAALAF
jgi:hypothetical protein